jgi:branched-chain amino acid transport system permease protein
MTRFILNSLVFVAIYGILTLSLNLQYGLAGLLNFGQALFLAIGAYAVATVQFHGLPPWLGVVLAPLVGGLSGALVALPARRLDGKYWALLTLAISELFLVVIRNTSWIAGGAPGTRGIFGVPSWLMLPILLVIIGLLVFGFERLRRSQFGRVIRTMREDPLLVRTFGRDIAYYQSRVMVLGGATGAIAGAALAHAVTFIAPDVFPLHETLLVWIMLVVGGLGSNVGAILGALIVQGSLTLSRLAPTIANLTAEQTSLLRLMIVSVVFVTVLIVRPRGAFPERPVRHVA